MTDETTDAYVATSTATRELRKQLQQIRDQFDPHWNKTVFKEMWSCFGRLETQQLALYAAALREIRGDDGQ